MPFRFVLPCRNFTADFAKLGLTAIKKVFQDTGVDFTKFTLENSFDFLRKIKGFDLRKDQQMILSVDAVQMYPSISLKMIKKAVFYYSKNLDRSKVDRIIWGLKLVEIAMNSSVCTFAGEYYRYGGFTANFSDTNSVCLSIGSFESAFFSDLVINYVLEQVVNGWAEKFYADFGELKMLSSYRDDGVLICQKGQGRAVEWLEPQF